MTDIPRRVERAAWEHRKCQRARAHKKGTAYCFKCDQEFGDHEALAQHNKAKH